MGYRRDKEPVDLFLPRLIICGVLCLAALAARCWAPAALEQARQVLLGGEEARAAFSQFTQSVAEGEKVVAAFSDLYDAISDGEAGNGQ